jgi:ethanolamine-phosphate cytidylyltransferase
LELVEKASKMMENDKKGKVAIYIDGGFDLPHSGHYNAIR